MELLFEVIDEACKGKYLFDISSYLTSKDLSDMYQGAGVETAINPGAHFVTTRNFERPDYDGHIDMTGAFSSGPQTLIRSQFLNESDFNRPAD
ncbi:hypothetical protein WA026_007217 [Henosepilachna vigintioctopunctata]|uniref:Uncharacterized protein n=1 Tax=Henosepilachna vigintioctopunctata TaxID=420089 RepID=A0AAW1V9Y3_9CUCU